MPNPIRVLIVDDSALMRHMLTSLFTAEPNLEVVGAAPDPLIARQMIKDLNPDVLTLDIEMPRMDGLAFLEKIMTLRPMPVVMVSTLTQQGAEATLQALELGAVDVVGKPTLDIARGFGAAGADLVAKVRAAAMARVRPLAERTRSVARPALGGFRSSELVIAVGASTGGVEALREVICALPPDLPGMVVVQHMPANFTASFSARLNSLAAVTVAEATDGARVLPGHVRIAPGGRHLRLQRSGANYICKLDDGSLQSGHKPSVDALFNSVAEVAGRNAIGVILTGMGRDGAEGMLRLHQAGAPTIAEDASTCVVHGMPKAAVQLGGVDVELPLHKIVDKLLTLVRESGRTARV